MIRGEITSLLNERLKDKHVAEVELFESAAERLFKYGKWFSTAVALPIALFLAGLTFFGLKKVHDINSLAARVDKEVKPKVESALHNADEASNKAIQAEQTAEQVTTDVNKQLASARGVTAKVETLSHQVNALESQTATSVTAATKRIESQLKELDQRVSEAQSQINEQQKKLTDTGELVKSLFANSHVEQFNETVVGRYIVREGDNRRVVYMLLTDIPIPQSVQIQFHIFTQPRNSYVVSRNVVIFFWADPAESLKQHPLLVSYVADPNAQEKPFKTLLLNKDRVFADSVQLPYIK
jgi:hypothetical protein